jgi:hypothetical protein
VTKAQAADIYLQLGAVVFALGLGARAAGRAGLSPIPRVLILAIAGPVLMRYPGAVDTLVRRLTKPTVVVWDQTQHS